MADSPHAPTNAPSRAPHEVAGPKRTAPRAAPSPHATHPLRGRAHADLPVSDQRLRLAGIPTAVLEAGEGPPLVLLHGQGEFAGVWRRVIPDLAETHRVIAPDLPGHGASELPDDALDEARVLRWMAELVDATCETPPTVAGHLLGGAIAARSAIRHPKRIARLVLVDTLGLGWYRPALPFAFAMVRFVMRPNERTRDGLFRRCMLDLDDTRRDMAGRLEPLEAYALDRARDPRLTAALRQLMPRVGVPPIPRRALAGIAVPTTLIHGRHDLQVRLRTAESAHDRYGWPLHVIEGAADDPAIEQPEAFLRAFREALAAV